MTRAIFSPFAAEFPASFAALALVNERPALAFDAATVEGVYWTCIAPQGLTGALTLVVCYCMASATSGKVDFEAAIEAVTPDDALDLDATTSFETANAANETVPGTAGYMSSLAITLTNADSIAAGDLVRVRLERDADDATDDTATGDCYVLAVELRDAA